MVCFDRRREHAGACSGYVATFCYKGGQPSAPPANTRFLTLHSSTPNNSTSQLYVASEEERASDERMARLATLVSIAVLVGPIAMIAVIVRWPH